MKLRLLFLLLPFAAFCQTPELQNLKEFTLPDKGDTIRFYTSLDTFRKTKIFLYLQGSGTYPMVHRTDSIECCFINFPHRIMRQFPKEYGFIYIQKTGLPYYANADHYKIPQKFTERNNVDDRAIVANKVLNYLLKHVYPEATVVAVLGHSEGSDVAARLAAMNRRVTHLCFSAGNGTPQVFNDILFIRRKMQSGEISADAAYQQLDSLFTGIRNVYARPNSTSDYFNGDTYKWHSAINKPAIEYLLKLKIPIYLTIGSHDEKVPVETTDYIQAEFIRHKKTNLTYKVYSNCNHNFTEKLSNGEEKEKFGELFQDFLRFIK